MYLSASISVFFQKSMPSYCFLFCACGEKTSRRLTEQASILASLIKKAIVRRVLTSRNTYASCAKSQSTTSPFWTRWRNEWMDCRQECRVLRPLNRASEYVSQTYWNQSMSRRCKPWQDREWTIVVLLPDKSRRVVRKQSRNMSSRRLCRETSSFCSTQRLLREFWSVFTSKCFCRTLILRAIFSTPGVTADPFL